MLGGREQFAGAFITIFHQRGNCSHDLGFVRFDGLQRIRAVFELGIGRGQIIQLVGKISRLVFQHLHLRLQLGKTRSTCGDLRFKVRLTLLGFQPLRFVELPRVPGLPVNIGQFGQSFLLLSGKSSLRSRLLGVQRCKPLLCREMLLLQLSQLSAQCGHALFGGTCVGLMGLLPAKQSTNGGIKQATLSFHLSQRMGEGGEAVFVASQFGHTRRDGSFLATQLSDLRLCVLHLLLSCRQRCIDGLDFVLLRFAL